MFDARLRCRHPAGAPAPREPPPAQTRLAGHEQPRRTTPAPSVRSDGVGPSHRLARVHVGRRCVLGVRRKRRRVPAPPGLAGQLLGRPGIRRRCVRVARPRGLTAGPCRRPRHGDAGHRRAPGIRHRPRRCRHRARRRGAGRRGDGRIREAGDLFGRQPRLPDPGHGPHAGPGRRLPDHRAGRWDDLRLQGHRDDVPPLPAIALPPCPPDIPVAALPPSLGSPQIRQARLADTVSQPQSPCSPCPEFGSIGKTPEDRDPWRSMSL